jgi:glyceraldehyde 3-phosphate dehydrogenase
VTVDGDYLVVGDKRIKVISEREIENLPWKDFEVDVVAECTGFFTEADKAREHIEKAGAKKVLISAPGKGDCFYFVRGVNDSDYDGQDIVSNGSCTTNSMTAIVNELNKKYGIEKGMFATVHSVTGDQRILDAVHKSLRRGRAGAFNIVPTTTGAAKSVVKLIPELEGKLHGIAYRVPTPDGSITDLNLELKTNVTKEEVNSFLEELSKDKLSGIIEVSYEPLVSSDIVGNTHSGIVDALSTEVICGNLLKLAIWYDNEWGFSNRMIEVIKVIGYSSK